MHAVERAELKINLCPLNFPSIYNMMTYSGRPHIFSIILWTFTSMVKNSAPQCGDCKHISESWPSHLLIMINGKGIPVLDLGCNVENIENQRYNNIMKKYISHYIVKNINYKIFFKYIGHLFCQLVSVAALFAFTKICENINFKSCTFFHLDGG